MSGTFGGPASTGAVHGGLDFDTLSLNIAFTVDLAAGTAFSGSSSFTISGFERVGLSAYQGHLSTVFGSSAAESFFVVPDANDGTIGVYVDGRGGEDAIFGSAGSDQLFGGDGNDHIYGGLGNDTINGGNGHDVLVGGNGVFNGQGGVDTLNGGPGSDTIYLEGTGSTANGDDGDDRISFFTRGHADGGAGNDTVDFLFDLSPSSLILNLSNFQTNGTISLAGSTVTGFENYGTVISGSALADVVIGSGQNEWMMGLAGNDVLAGNGGDDQLEGGGGVNELIGGFGDDIYVIVNASDSTVEYAGQGTDTVQTSLGVYVLQNNVERLTFTDNAAHGAGIGNALDNQLRGGTGADDLFGREGNDVIWGGTGTANTLFGQEGDDIFFVEAAGDSVIEFAGQGTDYVYTALSSFTLRDHVEVLIYTGSAAFVGIGSSTSNTLYGASANDFLSGLDGDDILVGGSGADILLGGAGADQFRFQRGETGLDRILDFTSGTDKIGLVGFSTTGTIVFVAGIAATSTNSTILYDSTTGILSYDADGTGSSAAVQVAQLNSGLTLTAGDFIF